jgi:hypothetical protein
MVAPAPAPANSNTQPNPTSNNPKEIFTKAILHDRQRQKAYLLQRQIQKLRDQLRELEEWSDVMFVGSKHHQTQNLGWKSNPVCWVLNKAVCIVAGFLVCLIVFSLLDNLEALGAFHSTNPLMEYGGRRGGISSQAQQVWVANSI